MNSEAHRHRIKPGETLVDIALNYGLPGWQALYFCDTNLDFRSRYPDPWRPEVGVKIGIPALPNQASELQNALKARIQLLNQVRRQIRQLLDRQCVGLREHLVPLAPSSFTDRLLPPLTALMVETTLEAIQLLKAEDTGMSQGNWFLARDAYVRHPPNDPCTRGLLVTLLALAVKGVVWGIPEQVARGWCDVNSPTFWGKSLTLALSVPKVSLEVLLALEVACRRSGEDVLRMVDMLHGGAVDEIGSLLRYTPAHPKGGAG